MNRLRLAVAGLAFVLLAVPTAAQAAVHLRGIDASAYPTIRASVYTPGGGGLPALWENGTPVAARDRARARPSVGVAHASISRPRRTSSSLSLKRSSERSMTSSTCRRS